MSTHSLTIVGTGIKTISHITTEARACVENADKLFYLVNEPMLDEWLAHQNQDAESLLPLYDQFPERTQNYHAIAQHVVNALDKNKSVCLALYGHPMVFCDVATYAIKKAKAAGYETMILPGISAEDCLFADLQIDPSSCGCVTYEATDLLLYRRPLNPLSHLLIWQVGMIGGLGRIDYHDNAKGIGLLKQYLQTMYPLDHPITAYEAAQYPHFKPIIQYATLVDLPKMELSPITTLYVPPAQKAEYDPLIAEAFQIKLSKK